MTTTEYLQLCRQNEVMENVLAILENGPQAAELRRVLLIWPELGAKCNLTLELGEAASWDQVWSDVRLDAQAMGNHKVTKDNVDTLRALHLIYPDGTISSVAQKALRTLAKTKLGL